MLALFGQKLCFIREEFGSYCRKQKGTQGEDVHSSLTSSYILMAVWRLKKMFFSINSIFAKNIIELVVI